MTAYRSRFIAREIEVFSVESFLGGQAHEPMWSLTYGDREDDGHRYCITSLHAATDSSVVTVVLGVALVELDGEVPDSDVEAEISGDMYLLSTIFERSRSTARTVLGLIDKEQDLSTMPEIEISSEEVREARLEESERGNEENDRDH